MEGDEERNARKAERDRTREERDNRRKRRAELKAEIESRERAKRRGTGAIVEYFVGTASMQTSIFTSRDLFEFEMRRIPFRVVSGTLPPPLENPPKDAVVDENDLDYPDPRFFSENEEQVGAETENLETK